MPYSPTITVSATPAIEVTMLGLSYNEFVNSLMAVQYRVNAMFMSAQSTRQLMQTYNYNWIDPNGMGYQNPIKPKVDPYQRQPTLLQNTGDVDFIFNGLSMLDFIVMAGETMSLEFCSDVVQFEPKGGPLDVLAPYEKMIKCL